MTSLRQWWCGLWWHHAGMILIRRTATGSLYRCRDCGKERFITKWDRETP